MEDILGPELLNVGQRVAFAVTFFIVAFGLLWEVRRERREGARTYAHAATAVAAVLLVAGGLYLLFPRAATTLAATLGG